jgi:hypothetical protein
MSKSQETIQCLFRWCSTIDSPAEVCFMTYGAYDAKYAQPVSSLVVQANAAAWGIARSARIELPHTSIRCFDFGWNNSAQGEDPAALCDQKEKEVLYDGRQRAVPRLCNLPALPNEDDASRRSRDASSSISGGLGGLELVAISELARNRAGCIAILGRRACLATKALAGLMVDTIRAHAETRVYACDMSDGLALSDVLELSSSQAPRIKGFWHAAGLIAQTPIVSQSTETS